MENRHAPAHRTAKTGNLGYYTRQTAEVMWAGAEGQRCCQACQGNEGTFARQLWIRSHGDWLVQLPGIHIPHVVFHLPLALDMGGSGILHLVHSCFLWMVDHWGRGAVGRGVRPKRRPRILDCATRTYRRYILLVPIARKQRHFDRHQCFC